MKKSELLNLLYNRIKELEYDDLLLDTYFSNLPMPLANQLANLSDRDLIVYLRIIELLINKELLKGNENKMYSISSTFLINLREEKVKTLIGLLINTDIIFNKNFILFANMLLQRWHPEKLKLIDEVLMSFNSLRNISIIDIMENIKRIKTPEQFNAYRTLILNKGIRSNVNFSKIKDLVLENPYNQNIELVAEAYESKTLINALRTDNKVLIKNSYDFITNYLMTANIGEAELILDIITNESLLNSYPIAIKLLNTVVNSKYKMYIPYIDKLVENKEFIDISIFDDILRSLFKATTALQIEGVMSILNFKNLLKADTNQVSLVLDKYLKITQKYQLIAFNKILEEVTKEENFDLYSEKIFAIINNIVKSHDQKEIIKDYQALCLANSFTSIIKLENYNFIINSILNEEKVNCNYIQALFQIPNIVLLKDFDKIFDKLRGSNIEDKKKNVIALLNMEKVINSSNYISLIDIINRANKYQGKKVLEIVGKVNNLENYELIKLLDVLLLEFDLKKIDLISELIKVYVYLGFEKTLSKIKLITDSNELKDIKDTVKEIKTEIKTTELKNKEGLNFVEKIKLKKLTRKVEGE